MTERDCDLEIERVRKHALKEIRLQHGTQLQLLYLLVETCERAEDIGVLRRLPPDLRHWWQAHLENQKRRGE